MQHEQLGERGGDCGLDAEDRRAEGDRREAARDEGPRLLPLTDKSKEPSRLEHYLDLADAALETKSDKDPIT